MATNNSTVSLMNNVFTNISFTNTMIELFESILLINNSQFLDLGNFNEVIIIFY